MKIKVYSKKYEKDVKALLKELQEYIINLDPYKFNKIENGYEDICFEHNFNEINNNNGIVYLAIENAKVLGVIMGIIKKPIIEFDYERNSNMGEITELIVSKNARANGIGQKLIRKMEQYFKENNCQTINIDVFGYNEIAKNFYFKNGYHTRMITVSKKIN